jgi:hypothetical protein
LGTIIVWVSISIPDDFFNELAVVGRKLESVVGQDVVGVVSAGNVSISDFEVVGGVQKDIVSVPVAGFVEGEGVFTGVQADV